MKDRSVALLACNTYGRTTLKEIIDALLKGLFYSIPYGAKIFLKPNLVTGVRRDGLACTNAEFVACVAEWFVDHGAVVSVADSPAFGRCSQVMNACGMTSALKGLPVARLDLVKKTRVVLKCGVPVALSTDILECDQLINLPKIKAHCQMLVSLAVKNLFGAVLGCQKALAHMRYGPSDNLFAALLVDLVSILPEGVTIVDGIVAMHKEGPVNGEAFHLGIAAAGRNPVALDTAILKILGIDACLSPLWFECQRRGMTGTDIETISFPLMRPASFHVQDFTVPSVLDPIRFQVGRFIHNGLRKLFNLNTFEKSPFS
jgi:uncharacterized protein (DUF362 family)